MKRILSLILVLVLALGSIPFAFADDAMTAGETLKDLGLIEGVAEGDLDEDGMLTRAQMMVILSRLNGVEEEAKNYAIPSTSKDVEGHWAAKYIAYAEQVGGWVNGVGNDMFAPNGQVTNQMVATLMLRVLGYEGNWDTAVQDATALGLMEGVSGEATDNIVRGGVFTAMLNALNTPAKDSDVKFGVALGVLEDETPVVVELEGTVDSVKAVANNLVEVVFEDDVDAAAAGNVANYAITERNNTSNVVVINSVEVEAGDTVVIETEALKAGVAYTVTLAEQATNFSGIAKKTASPKVESVKGTDSGIVEVVFEDALVDKATAEDIANYSIDKEGTVVAAELDSDRATVTLTVEGLTTTSAKNLTVENVLSVDKVAMRKVTRVFFPKYDKFGPNFTVGTRSLNNIEFVINVVDENGIDKATAEDISNYSVNDLDILEAKVSKSSGSDNYDRITLITSEQTNGKSYTVKINNLVDGSNAMNPMTKEKSLSYRGGIADKTAPSIKTLDAVTTTTIEVVFTENNLLNEETALNPANYELDKDDFQILEAKFSDDDDEENSRDNKEIKVILTTSEQPSKRANFRLTVTNVADEFNNTMSKTTRFFTSEVVDEAKPVVKYVKATTSEKVVVEFENEVLKATAEDPTNYVVDNGVGSPKEADLSDNRKVVTLKFEDLEANETYELVINNVTNLYDVVMDEEEANFVGLADGIDKDAPELLTYYMNSNNELRLVFDEKMAAPADDALVATGASKNFTFKKLLDDDKTMVLKASAKLTADFDIDTIDKAFVKDLAGNSYIYDEDDKFEVAVDADDNSEPELLSWAQKDLKTFILYFDSEVVSKKASITVDGTPFTVKEVDDLTTLELKASSAISEKLEGEINASKFATDLVENDAKDEDVTIAGGLVDESAPNIVSVNPIDKLHIEIVYDEDINYAGTYKFGELNKTTKLYSASADDNVVTITLTTAMDSDTIYELSQSSLATDFARTANRANDAGEFTFVGVSNDPATDTYFYGVRFISATQVEVDSATAFGDSVTATSASITVTGVSADAGFTFAYVNDDQDSLRITANPNTPFIEGNTYTVTLDEKEFEFVGVLEELEVTLTDSTYSVIGYSFDEDDTFQLVDADGSDASEAVAIEDTGVVTGTVVSGQKIVIKNASGVVIAVTEAFPAPEVVEE